MFRIISQADGLVVDETTTDDYGTAISKYNERLAHFKDERSPYEVEVSIFREDQDILVVAETIPNRY